MFFFKVMFLTLWWFSPLISCSNHLGSGNESQDYDDNSIDCCSFLCAGFSSFFRRLSGGLNPRIDPFSFAGDDSDSVDPGSLQINYDGSFLERNVEYVESSEEITVKDVLKDAADSSLQYLADHVSYHSFADSSDSESDNEDSVPTGQWTRLSALHIDVATSDDLYYHVEVTLTFGFKQSHPAYNYAKKILKACMILDIKPEIEKIISNRRLASHLFRFGLNIEECQEFSNFVRQTDIPDTSILYGGQFPLSEAAKWMKKRKIIIDIVREEIDRIFMEFDAANLKELIRQVISVSEDELAIIVDSLTAKIIYFIFIAEFERKDFISYFDSQITYSIIQIFEPLGINDESFTNAIESEIRYLLLSPLNLVFNYSGPITYRNPNRSYPFFK